MWVCASGSGSKPFSAALQKLAFKKEYLGKIITSADAILLSAAKQTVENAVRAAEKAAGPVATILAAIPNPGKHEKKFLTSMLKNGTSMNDHAKGMERAYHRAVEAAKTCGVAIEDLDSKGIGAKVTEYKNNALSLILTNSLATLLRAPQITSDEKMRTLAQQVYSRFQAEEELVLLPKYESEYLSNIGLPALSSNGETAEAPAAAEAAAKSPNRKQARH